MIDVSALGAAMLASIHANASTCKERGDHVDFNAWWRGGDGPSVRLYPSRATWVDCVTGDKGGAKDFARMAAGLDLRDFMARWGRGDSTTAVRAPAPVALPDPWANGVPRKIIQWLWEHSDRSFTDRWIQARGWPASDLSVDVIPFTNGPVWPLDAVVSDDGKTLAKWISGMATWCGGRPLVMPLRSARTCSIEALVFRWPRPNPGALKSATLPLCKLRDSDGTPRGYGDAGGLWRAPIQFLFEGGPDELAGTIVLHGVATCAGAVSAGELIHWFPVLGHRGARAIVVPHIDKAKSGFVGQSKSADLVGKLRAAGRDARLFPWHTFLQHLRSSGVNVDGIGDFSDAVKAAGWSGPRMAEAVCKVLELKP